MIKKILDKKLFYAIISVLIAIGLWIYVVNVENSETDVTIKNIQVVYEGEDSLRDNRNLVLGEEERADYITLSFSGRRSDINNLSKSNVTVNVDLTSIRSVGTYTLPYEIEFPTGTSSTDFDISKNNGYITVTLYKITSKDVEVKGEFVGSIAEGYISEGFEFSPATVKVYGTEKDLSNVANALVTLNRTDLGKTIQVTSDFILVGEDGQEFDGSSITCEETEVNYTYVVLMEKEVVLDINIIAGGGLDTTNTIYSISPSKITVAGDAEMLNDLNTIYLDTVDLADVSTGDVLTFSISLPNDIRNVSGQTQAEVTIRTVGISTKEIETDNISIANVPDGYKAELRTASLAVKVRGPESAIKTLTADALDVVVDLKGVTGVTGNITVPATITITDSEDVGVQGTYDVLVYVTVN